MLTTTEQIKALRLVEGFFLNNAQVYEWKNPLDMPIGRWMVFEDYWQQLGSGMTRDMLIDAINQVIEAMNTGTIVDAAHLMYILRDMVVNRSTHEVYVRIATVLFMFADEDMDSYDWELNEKKAAWIRQYDDRVFFYARLSKSLEPLGWKSANDIHSFLKGSEKIIRAYRSALFPKIDKSIT